MGVVPFEVASTAIEGLWFLTMKQIGDERGTVREFYRRSAFEEAGLPSLGDLVQVNVTETGPGAIRGMHAEHMWKLIALAHGEAFGAWVDLRDGPGRGTVVTRELLPGVQVLVPPGVANGFQSLGHTPTQYVYVFTQEWVPGMAGDSVHPLDPDLAIPWPLPVDPSDPGQLSAKDAAQPPLRR
jgi:dTDP-4-dehydrorhamnose 3,5-epimerase